MRGPALRAKELTVRFGDRTALRSVSVEASPGELVALTGPNGSGKTTLLRCVLGLVPPTEGSVELFGEAVSGLSIRERAVRVAWVPQDESPRDNVSAAAYVRYGRYARQPRFASESEEDREAASAALASVDLSDRADSGILELSGGERQRLLLARALAQGSPLLLLDEPTAHLDIGHQLDLLDRVRRLVRDRGLCAVAALHDLNLAARFADRVVVLDHGRLVADGRPGEVLKEDLLRNVWGVDAELRRDAGSGRPYLLPRRVSDPTRRALHLEPGRPRVHVIGGGGAGEPILRALVEDGYPTTAGALPLLDSDADACEELGVPYIAEIPFAPLSAEVRERHRAQMDASDAIVLAPIAVGPSNLANLEDLVGRPPRVTVILVEPPGAPGRDFTGGRASEVLARLRAEGAVSVADATGLFERLRGTTPGRSAPRAGPRPR